MEENKEILKKIRNILNIEQDKDYIDETFEYYEQYIRDDISDLSSVVYYQEERRKVENTINKKLKNGISYMNYLDNYEMLLSSRQEEREGILYRYGLKDGAKISEILSKNMNQKEIETLLNQRAENIIKEVENSRLMREIEEEQVKLDNTINNEIKEEELVKQYKELGMQMQHAVEKLMYIKGVHHVLTILYECEKKII